MRIKKNTLKYRKGKQHPNYKNGWYLKQHYCMDCGKKVSFHSTGRCSKCAAKYRVNNGLTPIGGKGKNCPAYKNGCVKDKQGYIKIFLPEHPHADNRGYIKEHRLVMEKKLGRYLTKDEIVHHLNEVKWDNRVENLCLVTKHTHNHNFIKQLQAERIKILEKKLNELGIQL